MTNKTYLHRNAMAVEIFAFFFFILFFFYLQSKVEVKNLATK